MLLCSITFFIMTQDDSKIATKDTSGGDSTSFISSGKWESWGWDSTYNDFFQETSDGNISIGPKAQKAGIEVFTTILGYILPLAIIIVVAGAFHVYVQKWGGATAIKENYTFLCPYLNYSITGIGNEYKCDNTQTIEASYTKKRLDIENGILNSLNEYIPIKLTKNILLTSPERKFAIDTYERKIQMDQIIEKFETIRNNSKSIAVSTNNISCNGITINNGNLTTQCSIYGWASGNDDENGKLGSSRIEALRFVSNLADTSKSQFILLNPPTSLSMEKIDQSDLDWFESRTVLSIECSFVPFSNSEKF